MTELDDFLASTPPPGHVVFAKVWGSRSHNLQLPTSDWDFAGVYATPLRKLVGLRPPPETWENKVEPHTVFHEIGKFAKLLLIGNPGILEMLFTDHLCVETPEWQILKAERRRFLTATAVGQYLGYANGQMKRLEKHEGQAGLHTKGGEYSEKWAYHITRLIHDALNIAQGGEPAIWIESGSQLHDTIMQIRRNEWTWQQVRDYISNLMERIAAMKPFNLPETGDENVLNDWLLKVRVVA